MWQELRDELAPKGFELVTVGLDTLGAQGCGHFIEATSRSHPELLDTHHLLASRFGVVNIPSAFWVNEEGNIVRPPEPAPAPPVERAPGPRPDGPVPERFRLMAREAKKIPNDAAEYHLALRDWVENGEESSFALSPNEVLKRSRPRSTAVALGHAHFELASHLEVNGDHEGAVAHFREAHRLVPDSWTFRRQAWSLEGGPEGPFARFWQGPSENDPDAWPYASGWLEDVRSVGPENYNPKFKP